MGVGVIHWGNRARAESKVEETSVLHPNLALDLSDAVLVNSPSHFSHFENCQGLVSLLKLASVRASVLASSPARGQSYGPPTDGSI